MTDQTQVAAAHDAARADSSLVEEWRQRLKQHAPLSELDLEFVGKIEARHSELLEFRDRSPAGQAVLVKRITRTRNPAEAGSRLVREFATLETLAARLDPDVAETVPRALLVLPEAKAIVLEKLRGRPLASLLKRDANRFTGIWHRRTTRELGFRVGRWLQKFHRATQNSPRQHDHASYITVLEEQVERCRQHGMGRTITDLFEWASVTSRAAEGEPIPSAARHGDFIPQNILVDGPRLAVVDFENFREQDVVYEDIGTFLGYLAMMQGRSVYSRGALRAMSHGFLQGYGPPASPGVLNLYVFRAAVTITAEFQPRTGLYALPGGAHRVRKRLIDTAHELLPSGGVQPEQIPL